MNDRQRTVLITDTREKEALAAAAYLREQGYRVVENNPETGVKLNDEAALNALADELGDIAGVIHPAPPRILAKVAEATDEQWITAREEGVIAAWTVTKVFCGKMKEQGYGAMIYLGSVHAEKPVGGGFLYSIGCGATQMLCREASQDYAEFGVNCFYVQRGPMERESSSRSDISHFYYGLDMRYPQRRTPKEGHLNGLLKFLLSDDAWTLNGADLRADGGMTMFYCHRRMAEGREYIESRNRK